MLLVFFLSCFPCSRCRESKSSPPHHQHTLSVWWHRTTRSVRSQDGRDSIWCHSLWPSKQCCPVLRHRGRAGDMRLLGKVRVPLKGFNRCPALPSRAWLTTEPTVTRASGCPKAAGKAYFFLVQNLDNFYADYKFKLRQGSTGTHQPPFYNLASQVPSF